jgi:hypothetical protein
MRFKSRRLTPFSVTRNAERASCPVMLRPLVFASLLLSFGPQGNLPPIRPSPISMTIAPEKDAVVAGAPIVVKIKFKNISEHDVVIDYTGPYKTFDLIALDAKGHLVPDTEFGEQMKHIGPFNISGRNMETSISGMNIVTSLKPNQSWDGASITVTEIRVMTSPGKYSIQLTPDLGKFVVGNAIGTIKSNKITVTVTESPAHSAASRRSGFNHGSCIRKLPPSRRVMLNECPCYRIRPIVALSRHHDSESDTASGGWRSQFGHRHINWHRSFGWHRALDLGHKKSSARSKK